jgi:cell wall-associated NlpC family hydrolase
VDPREAQALLAPARQLTPPAYERERFAATTIPDPCLGAVRACRRVLCLGCGRNRRGEHIGADGHGQRCQYRRRGPVLRRRAEHPVKKAIWAGDQIRLKPYRVGGGHGKWHDSAYDCSGAVSYVLHAAGLLKISEDSGEMESWGQKGLGQWITVYTNPGHAFIEIAGIRMDTSREGDPHPAAGTGPRWRPVMDSTSGYIARHPSDL